MKNEHKEIFRKIIYAVETGSQLYGKADYDSFVEAFTNSEKEYAITIGAGQWYGIEAKELLRLIQFTNPQLFAELDTENIESDLNNCDWNTYQLECDSKKAGCIRKIIGSSTGIKCQDAMMDEQCEAYIREAIGHGVDNIQAQMMYGNITHLGGTKAAERILSKMKKPYTLDGFYIALTTDQSDKSSDNQVGDKRYWSRHVHVYTWIKDFVTDNEPKGDKKSMGNYASRVIDIAKAEVGYLEKKSNKDLDSKTANAGSGNYTKYGRDMHNLYPSVMDFPAAWCDAFVDWCFQKAYGVANAKGLLGGNFDDYTVASAQLYKNKNAYHKTPKVGDQIFFRNSKRICHTGLVYKVDATKVYTIEGNTSGASGVIANGGGVCKKSYYLTYAGIDGYGRPKYDEEPTASTTFNVKKGQKWLNNNYGELLKKHLGALLTIDNDYGKKSRAAAICVWKDLMNRKYGFKLDPGNDNFLDTSRGVAEMALIKKGKEGTLVYLVQFVLSAKGFYSGKMDADFGSGTKSAVEAFQRSRGLTCDGVVGKDTWYALFN